MLFVYKVMFSCDESPKLVPLQIIFMSSVITVIEDIQIYIHFDRLDEPVAMVYSKLSFEILHSDDYFYLSF